MITYVKKEDKNIFNSLASHPLQIWEWGDFREKTGIKVLRLGKYEKNILLETAQITIHQLPFTSFTIGYLPKCKTPSKEMLTTLFEVGKQNKCIFIKFEPNIEKNKFKLPLHQDSSIYPSPHPLFTKYTFQLDLTKSEKELLKNMHPKTRYNIKVAQKNHVAIKKEESKKAFDGYLSLLLETTKRQQFFAHNKKYHELMWETLHPSGVAHLLTAKIDTREESIPLVAWVIFLSNGVLYYPYGASSNLYRNMMASNLMMWEAIKFGKKNNAKLFDMWGALGPNPDPTDPWYGFHRFKQGYGARLVEFAGSFDLVINPVLYRVYNTAHSVREFMLKITSRLR